MKKLFLAAVAALISISAQAADLPTLITKGVAAPVVCTPGNCSGWYAGFGLTGNGTNADIVGNGINGSVFAAGGAIDVHGGYQLWTGQIYAAAEGSIGYWFQSATGGNVPVIGNNLGNSFMGLETVKLGYNFFPSSASANVVAGQSPIPLIVPANLLAASTPYFVVGGMQRNGKSFWVNGAGITTIYSSNWSGRAEYLYAPAQQGQPANQIVRIGLDRHFNGF